MGKGRETGEGGDGEQKRDRILSPQRPAFKVPTATPIFAKHRLGEVVFRALLQTPLYVVPIEPADSTQRQLLITIRLEASRRSAGKR